MVKYIYILWVLGNEHSLYPDSPLTVRPISRGSQLSNSTISHVDSDLSITNLKIQRGANGFANLIHFAVRCVL